MRCISETCLSREILSVWSHCSGAVGGAVSSAPQAGGNGHTPAHARETFTIRVEGAPTLSPVAWLPAYHDPVVCEW